MITPYSYSFLDAEAIAALRYKNLDDKHYDKCCDYLKSELAVNCWVVSGMIACAICDSLNEKAP